MGESAERQQPNHMENFLWQNVMLIHWCLNDKMLLNKIAEYLSKSKECKATTRSVRVLLPKLNITCQETLNLQGWEWGTCTSSDQLSS